MKAEVVYLVGIHRYSYRAGEPAKIIGVGMCTPDPDSDPVFEGEEGPRLGYHVKYSDGIKDWVAVIDTANYKIITFKDILEGNIPEVTE